MSQTSKFSDNDLEKVITAIKIAIEVQKAPATLSMMALGETLADIIKNNFKPEQQASIAAQFSRALQDSIKE
ncbi:DUF1414 domain-containing protein [Catenovulum sp. 2E275]|uniref:DUF1414 domain-containing protein n=1 Tax=Catenovulum sp. 2E275 TaxID=2980497 RepID=UPI0021CDEE7D|nr:DUF1414 domain-containing protein [Catenovulum sp. 2E275]MCU4674502.1 DUF1414 domain-containing protein [Catenovulum sp. 2E275]